MPARPGPGAEGERGLRGGYLANRARADIHRSRAAGVQPRAERTSRADEEARETLSLRLYGRNPPGPAGPDAESQNPDDTGNAWSRPPPAG